MDILPHRLPTFRANLHAHSTCSDGACSPEELKAFYLSKGISIVAFTEHEIIRTHHRLTEPGLFTALVGYELGFNDVLRVNAAQSPVIHLNLLAKRPELRTHVNFRPEWCWGTPQIWRTEALHNGIVHGRTADAQTINKTIADANDLGFLVTLNHPAWSLIPETLLQELRGLWGFEIYNTSASVNGGSTDPSFLYDSILRAGQASPFCVAADDTHLSLPSSHPRCDRGRAWVTLFAPDQEYASVISALEQGRFYASTGPEIYRLQQEKTCFLLDCSPVRSVYLRSAGRRVSSVLAPPEGPLLTSVKLPIKPTMTGPLRLILTAPDGTQAWTNPIPFPPLS